MTVFNLRPGDVRLITTCGQFGDIIRTISKFGHSSHQVYPRFFAAHTRLPANSHSVGQPLVLIQKTSPAGQLPNPIQPGGPSSVSVLHDTPLWSTESPRRPKANLQRKCGAGEGLMGTFLSFVARNCPSRGQIQTAPPTFRPCGRRTSALSVKGSGILQLCALPAGQSAAGDSRGVGLWICGTSWPVSANSVQQFELVQLNFRSPIVDQVHLLHSLSVTKVLVGSASKN